MNLKLSVVCVKSNAVKNFTMATTVENSEEITSFVSLFSHVQKIKKGLRCDIFKDFFKNVMNSIP